MSVNIPELKSHGLVIPRIGFGTWQLYGESARETVLGALEVGYRHIDTARAYENATHVGKAIAESGIPRDELFLTDKILPLGRHSIASSSDSVKWAVDEALYRLDTDYVDLLLLHWPIPGLPLEVILPAMADLVELGWVRGIGVSNFPPAMLQRATDLAPIAVNQVEYHPFLSQSEVIDVAKRHDIVVAAHTPFASGRVFVDETLQAIANRHEKTIAQICIRWLIDQPNVVTVPMAPTPEWQRDNLDVLDISLSDQDRLDISSLACGIRNVNPPFAPDWNE